MSARTLGLVFVVLNGLIALAFGLFGLVNPAGTGEAVRLQAVTDFGLGEISALYGGMWTAIGLVVLRAAHQLHRDPFSPAAEWVRTIGWCWIGLPLGRAVGAARYGWDGGPTVLFLLAEVAMIATLLLGLTLLRRPRT